MPMAQSERIAHFDHSKRESQTQTQSTPSPREYSNPFSGLNNPFIIGVAIIFAAAHIATGTFMGLPLSITGAYILCVVYSCSIYWNEPVSEKRMLDGEFAWFIRLLVACIGFFFVELGLFRHGMNGYAIQAAGFFILACHNILLAYSRKHA